MKKIIVLLMFTAVLFAQEKDANKLLQKVTEHFEEVRDYKVEATIKVDVNFLRVPETKAVVYFKQPDKVKLDSDGFALLPKQGLNFSPTKLLQGDYTAVYTKADEIDGYTVDVVKVLPNSDSTDILLTTLWIDPEMDVIRKIEAATKKNGAFEIALEYDNDTKALPSSVVFSFNVSDLQIPASMTGEFADPDSEQNKKGKKNEPMVGTVTVLYRNYEINKGLPDSMFEEGTESGKEN